MDNAIFKNIYENIIHFINYRGMKIKRESSHRVNFLNFIVYERMYNFECEGSDGTYQIYLHIDNDLKKPKIIDEIKFHAADHYIFIIPSELFSKQIIENKIRDIIAATDKDVIFYGMNAFSSNFPEQPQMSTMKILSEAELKKIEDSTYTPGMFFPKVPENDTAMIWLGARKGDFVSMMRPSQSIGLYGNVYEVI